MKTFHIILLIIAAISCHFFALKASEEFETVFAFIATICYASAAFGITCNIYKWFTSRK